MTSTSSSQLQNVQVDSSIAYHQPLIVDRDLVFSGRSQTNVNMISSSLNGVSRKIPEFIAPFPFRICIEGNIAAGKSQLCENLKVEISKLFPDVEVIILPEIINQELLAKFDNDPETYALEFQETMCRSRVNRLIEAYQGVINGADLPDRKLIFLMDTGPLREIAFTRANEAFNRISKDVANEHLSRFEKTLNEKEDEIRKSLNESKKKFSIMPEVMILLDANPYDCNDNKIRRGRKSEEKLTLKYLNQLRRAHFLEYTAQETMISKIPHKFISSGFPEGDYKKFPSAFKILGQYLLKFSLVD